MKRAAFLPVLCSFLLFVSCKIDLSYGNWKRIEPSSTIVKNEYKLGAFNQVDIDVVANVKFIQSDKGDHRVILSCPENYVDLFKFEVEKNELNIEFVRNNVNIEAQNVDITVYAPELRKLENSGVSSVELDRLKSDFLEIDNSGVGTVYLSGLQVDEVDAECSGVGNVELNGEAVRVKLDCSGVGSIKAEGLKAKTVEAEVSGVGGVRCFATERIEGRVSGVGSLTYGGNPSEKKFSRDGVGGISEL